MATQIKNIFISHIHEDDAGLGKLKSLLERNGMTIRDYSINSDKPNNATSEAYIKSAILAPQIQASGALIVYITPDTKNSDYVNWEIEYAQKMGKRIIGVWANGENGCEVPEALDTYADAIVGWHGNSIIDAINGENKFEQSDGTARNERRIFRVKC
jgi:MTH538 TIR-like domain (DUF1863)